MTTSVTVELTPEAFAQLGRQAEASGLTAVQLARLAIEEQLSRAQCADVLSRPTFESFIGCFDSGDPVSADNERIDTDLAREYHLGADAHAD